MPEYTDVTAAIIEKEGRVLIACRTSGSRRGLWEFPGGKQETGETLEACLVREIREELGLDIDVGRHFLTVEQEYPDIRIRLHCFACTASGDPAEMSDHHEIRWVKQDELAEYSFPEADRAVAERLMLSPGGTTVNSPR